MPSSGSGGDRRRRLLRDHLRSIAGPLGQQRFIILRSPEIKPPGDDILTAATAAGRAPKKHLMDHEEPLERAIAGLSTAIRGGLDLLEHIGHHMRPGHMKRLRDFAHVRERIREDVIDLWNR